MLAQSPAALIIAASLVGLVVGSFLNVVIYRLPVILERQWRQDCAELAGGPADSAATPTTPSAAAEAVPFNLLVPRSACPACHTAIRAWHNVPVVSWLLLRGRCAYCQARISARYPAIELLCALLTALTAWRFGYSAQAACAIVITWFLIALTFIDL